MLEGSIPSPGQNVVGFYKSFFEVKMEGITTATPEAQAVEKAIPVRSNRYKKVNKVSKYFLVRAFLNKAVKTREYEISSPAAIVAHATQSGYEINICDCNRRIHLEASASTKATKETALYKLDVLISTLVDLREFVDAECNPKK
ncbi:MAG: hypothetical protein U0264_05405 [Candidatus Kapaibacterium sp.]